MTQTIPTSRPETEEERKKRLEPLIALREKKREEWRAFWKFCDLEAVDQPWLRFRFAVMKAFDTPVTWWREKVVEPLQDKYGHWPFYHRRFGRVPTVDECHVNDLVCHHEANMQYRLDKLVDNKILDILKQRRNDCFHYHNNNMMKCLHQIEDYEEAELNWYIKYGEMGYSSDALTCYMKQKHRMIWERRNPEIMALRQEAYEDHKRQLGMGIYDHWFWKRSTGFMFKDYKPSEMARTTINPYTFAIKGGEDVSLNPEYFRKKQEDEKAGKVKYAGGFEAFP